MNRAITIIDPRTLEASARLVELDWWALGVAGAVVVVTAVVGLVLVRRRLGSSMGELAGRALARHLGLDRRARRALWCVADELGVRDRAGVLLLSRSALLDAVGRLAGSRCHRRVSVRAALLVERLIGQIPPEGKRGK